MVINADIWTDYPFNLCALPEGKLCHLVLVKNPAENSNGDYSLTDDGHLLTSTTDKHYTFSGIRICHPALFSGCTHGYFRFPPLLIEPAKKGLVTAEHYDGIWHDVGTPERLDALLIDTNK